VSGIFFDNGSQFVEVTDSVFYDTGTAWVQVGLVGNMKITVTVSAVSSTSATLSWIIENPPTGYQGVYVGRDGVDTNGSGAWESPLTTGLTGTREFLNLLSATNYTLHLETQVSGQRVHKATVRARTDQGAVVGPGPTDPGEPIPNTQVPVLGRSGLPFNAGLFMGNGSASSRAAFESWRGRLTDAAMYFPGRATWSEMLWLNDELNGYQGYRIIALPTQPTSMNNSSTAAGNNNQWWRDYGTALVNKGWHDGRTILRLNWEANLTGNPYAFDKPNAATFVNAVKNVVNSVRQTAPNTKFSLCVNKSNIIPGIDFYTQIATPLLAHIDIISLDWYDHGPAQVDTNSWNTAANQVPGGNNMVAFCRANGKKMWLEEWGVSRGNASQGWPGGGDNPFFIQKMWEFINANLDVIVGETTYNDPGAPSTLNHVLYPRNSGNPNASDRYKLLWGA